MKDAHPRPLRRQGAFSLLEVLVVLVIVALLAALGAPEYGRMMERAKSAACMGNLRAVGAALGSYLSDHDGRMPYINNPDPYPIYSEDDDLPEEVTPITLVEAFGPYGIPNRGFRCPSDAAMNNQFAKLGTSYEWIPRIDGEQSVAPKVLARRGQLVTRKINRIVVLREFDPVHFGRSNRLYGDGRVIAVQR